MKNPIPYPLRATRITLDLNPFGFWMCPDWHVRRNLSEFEKSQGRAQWWFRWLWFQISFSRWL